MVIDTACSSALVALHHAVQALRDGRCHTALVGAVNVIASTHNSLMYNDAGILSKRGQCRTFDRDADGYVRGEGKLVLKRLCNAHRNGDKLAIIKGVAINHGQSSSHCAQSCRASVLIERALAVTACCR